MIHGAMDTGVRILPDVGYQDSPDLGLFILFIDPFGRFEKPAEPEAMGASQGLRPP
jgi:hypothetical protein